MMTVNVNSRKLNEQLGYLHDALVGAGQAGDAATLIKDQTRILIKETINFTYPKKHGQPSDRKQGEAAVSRDIQHAMRVPLEDDFKSEDVKKLIRNQDQVGFQAFCKNTKEFRYWRVEPFSEDLHRKKRDRRGRIQRQKRVFVMEKAKVQRYIKETQKHVGYMRAGWIAAANAVGLTVKTPWVRRHTNRRSIGVPRLTGEHPSVTIGNTTPGIGQIRNAFDRALKTRQFKIQARIRLILSGYAKDIAAGIRPRKRAKELNASA